MNEEAFLVAQDRPVLVDFANSILTRESFVQRAGASAVVRHVESKTVRQRLRSLVRTRNAVAERVGKDILARLGGRPVDKPGVILVIGSGEVGNGMEEMYRTSDVALIGLDIYVSDSTDVVADAHQIPFADGTFDAVWIQAVLEHVLDPQMVVDEIWRVLRPDGVVFSSTPFMQQVHEQAYDFARFTRSGHRWLYRRFDVIEAGSAIGVGTALFWSLRYFFRGVVGSKRIGDALAGAFFWLKVFDRATKLQEDGASVTYIYGRKSEHTLTPSEIVQFYSK
ncbi:class I SAM-dependent methyltransferase [Novosphingobium sp. PASSN1]|uniref:class I SAM-dependent methyltransferase n=1 Tax=Novosphingobium sp. PASSN1 TaxID=2015561 RepID=UPI0026001FA0|nr:class I SAM-dependent methyltransferase [Novosphingobium sp. PASSN1]